MKALIFLVSILGLFLFAPEPVEACVNHDFAFQTECSFVSDAIPADKACVNSEYENHADYSAHYLTISDKSVESQATIFRKYLHKQRAINSVYCFTYPANATFNDSFTGNLYLNRQPPIKHTLKRSTVV